MRRQSARETLVSRYMPSKKIDMRPGYTGRVTTKKGATLEDFYREVHSTNTLNTKHIYHNKNAAEIEWIMRHNRKQIDDQ